jgi:hypothetical protein
MKKNLFFSLLLLFAILGLFCFANAPKSLVAEQKGTTPQVIVLKDEGLGVSLSSTKNGNNWEISSTSVGSYLAQVAAEFGKTNVSNFQNITIIFSPDYSTGLLIGNGTDGNGARVPIGVEYVQGYSSGDTTFLRSGAKHTCTGNPCNCCDFLRSGDRITGCTCINTDPSHCSGGTCNHTISSDK